MSSTWGLPHLMSSPRGLNIVCPFLGVSNIFYLFFGVSDIFCPPLGVSTSYGFSNGLQLSFSACLASYNSLTVNNSSFGICMKDSHNCPELTKPGSIYQTTPSNSSAGLCGTFQSSTSSIRPNSPISLHLISLSSISLSQFRLKHETIYSVRRIISVNIAHSNDPDLSPNNPYPTDSNPLQNDTSKYGIYWK